MPRPTLPSEAETAAAANASWIAIVAVGIGAFALVTTEFLPVGLLPLIARDIGVSEGRAGLMVTAPGIAAAIAAPLSIGIGRHIDRRVLLCIFLAAVCLSNILVAASTGLATIVLARIIMGLGLGGFWTIGGSLGPRLRSGQQGAKATAIILSGISLGTVAGVPAGAFIGAYLGWRAPFLMTAGLAGLVAVALLILLPPVVPQRGSGLGSIRKVLSRPRARLAIVVTIPLFGGQFAAYTFITSYLKQIIHIDAASLSFVLLCYGTAGFFGNIVGGWLSYRGEKTAVVTTAFVLAAAITSLLVFGTTLQTAGVCVAFWGLGFGMLPVTNQIFMLSSAPDYLESAAAILVSTIQISIGVGSLIGGEVADLLGVPATLCMGAVSIALAGTTLLCSSLIRHVPTSSDRTCRC